MKPARTKGSKSALKAGFCCHRRSPHETCQDQCPDESNQREQKQPPRCFLQYAFTVPDFFVILEKDQLICN
jgi:hypothetical protein